MTTKQSHVRVKSYFANSVAEAMEQARKDMGPDALLLDSRRTRPEAHHLGSVEVIFGESSEPRAGEPAPPERTIRPAQSLPAQPGMDELRRRMDELRNLLLANGGPIAASSTRSIVEQVLVEAGLTPALAAEIDESVTGRLERRTVTGISQASRPQAADSAAVLQETVREIQERFRVAPTVGRITALVGPPGAGKTTTLVKLAVQQGLMKGRPVRLISADWQRIAASEQLRIYAAILGVQFQSVDSVSALEQIVNTAPANALLLIDTPGISPSQFDGDAAGLAAWFRQRQDIDTHLVLTATMRPADLESAANRFAVFAPSALIFTRLDETDSCGALFSEAIRSRRPVSFVCNGQSIPENIEPATAHSLTESLVRQLPEVLRSAA